jgi:PAS domain S-box-containing protein
MADPTQKSDKRTGEPVSGTFENPGSRPSVDLLRDSKPDRAWPIPQEPRMRESIAAPRPSHVPAAEWTLDSALRAAQELEADLREKEDEPRIARAFVDALRQILPDLEVTVRMFTGASVGWYVASADLASATGARTTATSVAISRTALSRARTFNVAIAGGAASKAPEGLTLPAVQVVDVAEPIVPEMSAAVDALATDDGSPVAVVTVETRDAARIQSLEPVVALFADKLGQAIGRLRGAHHAEFLRRYLQEMFEHSSGPIIAIAPDRTVRAVNQPALALIEEPIGQVIGRDLVSLLRNTEHQERVEELFAAVLGGKATGNYELRVTRRDGTVARTRWNTATILDVDGTVGAIVAMGEDLSDVQRLEQQIIHAEKLATLGQLAAGVLHELNNPLTSITVYSEYLLGKGKRAGADPSDLEKLGRIVESAARMTKFTRDLVTYARPASELPAPVSMIEVLEQSLGFCEHVLDEAGVLVERSYAQDLRPVQAVRGQLHQIFVNLITNASQAMSADQRRAQSSELPRPKLSVALEGRGDFVVVRIADNGPGIPAENLARIFEPFFTTKGEGKGTGLGLSIVRNLVEQHGGTISVESRAEAARATATGTTAPGTISTGPSGTAFELRFRMT